MPLQFHLCQATTAFYNTNSNDIIILYVNYLALTNMMSCDPAWSARHRVKFCGSVFHQLTGFLRNFS